jgi:hypothetical protein
VNVQFDEQFFHDIGLGSASDEERAKMVGKLTELVQDRVAAKLSDMLTEEQLAHFDKLLDTESDDVALAYVEQVYPQYQELLQLEIDTVKQQFVADVHEAVANMHKQPPQS